MLEFVPKYPTARRNIGQFLTKLIPRRTVCLLVWARRPKKAKTRTRRNTRLCTISRPLACQLLKLFTRPICKTRRVARRWVAILISIAVSWKTLGWCRRKTGKIRPPLTRRCVVCTWSISFVHPVKKGQLLIKYWVTTKLRKILLTPLSLVTMFCVVFWWRRMLIIVAW